MAPKIYIVAAIGGSARELQMDTVNGTFPIWSSDGKYLLFHGRPEKSRFGRDWLVAPVEGGHAVSTGMAEASAALGLRGNLPIPRAWSSEGILFQQSWAAAGTCGVCRLHPRTGVCKAPHKD